MVSNVGTSFFVAPLPWSALGDLTLHPPIFVARDWIGAQPPNMILPPKWDARGAAQLFAGDASFGGFTPRPRRRPAPLSLAAAGKPSGGDEARPRFSTPLEAKAYAEQGWELYLRTSDARVREQILDDIRIVPRSDIERLVHSWTRGEPLAYEALCRFAFVGHRYARQEFVAGILGAIVGEGKGEVKAIAKNIGLRLNNIWHSPSENHSAACGLIRGYIVTLCEMAARGNRKALEAVASFLDPLLALSQRFPATEAAGLLTETVYLLAHVDPSKLLDDPEKNRRALGFLAKHGNVPVLDVLAEYAARGDADAALTLFDAALELSAPAIFDRFIKAAHRDRRILLMMLESEKTHEILGHGESSASAIVSYIRECLKGFELGEIPLEYDITMFALVMMMSFLGNRGAIRLAADLTGRLADQGLSLQSAGRAIHFSNTALAFFIENYGSACEEASVLIQNLARLGHKGAKEYLSAGGLPSNKPN